MDRPKRLSARDLYALPVVSGCAVHPAKHSVAYVVTAAQPESDGYHGTIRVLRLGDRTTRSYTFGSQQDATPQWSADGAQIFFLSKRSGRLQIWSIATDGGEPQPLPEVEGAVTDFAVSPDGRHLAVVATPETVRRSIEERGWRRVTAMRYRADGYGYLDDPSRLWLIDLHARSARAISDGSGFAAAPAWSPDGSRVAFSGEHNPEADMLWHHELWIADAAAGFRPKVALRLGGALEAPSWSPHGMHIAFVGLQDAFGSAGLKNLRLFTVAGDGSGLRCWTADTEWTANNLVLTDTGIAGHIPPPVWLDEQTIAVCGTHRGCARVFAAGEDGRARALTPATHSVVQFAALDAHTLVLSASDPVTPPELYLCREGQELQALSGESLAWRGAAGLRRPVRFSVDGPATKLDAWYLRSDDSDTARPAVLQIHGGPHFSYGEAFLFEFQLLAAHGYDVVYCNPRGSQGYGEAFAAAITGDWATPAFLDCMAVLDEALERYPLDRLKLAVAGGSYGGYLTSWTIGHTARFAAAIAMRPATNLASLWGTSEVGRMLTDELGGRPNDIPEVYRRCSPLSYADAISTPLLITQGENDYRTPPEQSEQLFSALRSRGQTVELLRFLNADHGLSRTGAPRARVARLEAILEWLERFLLAPGSAARDASAVDHRFVS